MVMARISLNPPKALTAPGVKDRCEMPSPAGSSPQGANATAT